MHEELTFRACKLFAASTGIEVTKVPDSFHDAYCKVALMSIRYPMEHAEQMARAQRFVSECLEAGRPWRLKEIRDLRRRVRELQEFREEIASEDSGSCSPACTASPRAAGSRGLSTRG